MAFHFLSTIKKDIQHVAQGDSKAGGGVFGFLGSASQAESKVKQTLQRKTGGSNAPGEAVFHFIKSSNQQLAKTPETAIRSSAELESRVANKFGAHLTTDYSAPTNSLTKKLYGTDEVQTYQQRGEGVHQVHPGIPSAAAALGIAGLDVTPGGAGKKNLADDLVRSSTAKDAFKALTKGGVDEATARKIAPAVAQTKDAHTINRIIDNAHKPPALPPTPIQDISPPTPGGTAEAAGQGNEARNRFLDTIKNAPSTSPEFKDAISGLRETHPQRDTMALSDAAKKTVEEKPDEVLARILTSPAPKDTDVAEGIHLMRTLQQDAAKLKASGSEAEASAKLDTANKLAEDMVSKATAGGRYSQAHSIMNNMSPEGIYYNAVKKVQNVREANPKNVAKEKKLAGEIQGQLEKPTIGKKEVSNTVKDIANEDISTGEKLAKNVESAATPTVKKPTDALVQELTKKVKQEYLAPVSQVKRDPLDVLKETFGRADEAHQAYPEAQQILREKFASDPKMSEALDKFFGSKLDLPAANSTINKAIQNQLKTNGDRVSEVIHKSLVEQGQSVEKVAQELTKEGFDENSAKTLAQEVHKRLASQFSDAKKAKLEQLSKDAPERGRSTYIDKLNKLSNLGALDKEDYLHLARAQLNLPHLTPEASAKISELSQKLQGLPEGHEKASTVREISNQVHGSIPLTKGQYIKNIPGLMRTIVASGDFSFGGRQGLAYATSHPISFAKAWPKQFEYFKQAFKGGDSEAFDAMQADIKNHPDYGYLEKSGLAILDPHAHLFQQREEQFIGAEIAAKIPGLRKIVDGSNYAYTGLANTLRANEFYGQLEHLRAAGVEIDEGLVKNLAKVINNSTGRGDLGRFEKLGNALSTGLFAPRLIASRVNMMDPRYYANLPPPARKEAVRQLLGLSAFGVGILGMAKAAGFEVEMDPRSSDFGKIKDGDTRFDVLGGFTQYIRFGTQLVSGQKINSTTGAQTEAGKGLAGSRLDILLNFFENKEAPFPSLVSTELKGKDISGNSIYNLKGQKEQLLQRFIPLLAQDIGDLFSHPNGSSPLTGVLAGLGTGVQTYGQQDLPITGKEKTYLEDLQTKGADKEEINASRQFFQLLKSAPDKQKSLERVHRAIDGQDYQQAQQLAQEYNDKLDSHIADSGWVDDNGQHITPYLEKQYKAAKINLTPQSVKAYLKSKKGP
jgi:hypothetical protein